MLYQSDTKEHLKVTKWAFHHPTYITSQWHQYLEDVFTLFKILNGILKCVYGYGLDVDVDDEYPTRWQQSGMCCLKIIINLSSWDMMQSIYDVFLPAGFIWQYSSGKLHIHVLNDYFMEMYSHFMYVVIECTFMDRMDRILAALCCMSERAPINTASTNFAFWNAV